MKTLSRNSLVSIAVICCLLPNFGLGYVNLPFVQPCSRSQSQAQFEACLTKNVNGLAMRFKSGLPELGYQEVEPIVLDEIQITLGNGANAYRAKFTQIEARGVSNVRVTALRSAITDDEVQLQVTMIIPKILAKAKYESSGTLILIQAGGRGDYWGQYEDVKAKVYIKAKPVMQMGTKFLKVQEVKMDFTVRDIKMGVVNVKGQSPVIQAALNLFINSNGQELLREMKPALNKKLVQKMMDFITNICTQVPYNAFISD